MLGVHGEHPIDRLSPLARVGVEGLLEKSESLRSYPMEGREVVQAHPPQVVRIMHARFLERAGGRGADGG